MSGWTWTDRGTAVKKTPEDAVDETDCYDMKRSPHGTVLIINNESFRSPCLSKRDGTAADVSSLQGLFRQLGFRCDTKKDIHNNVTAESMKKLVKKYAGGDHSKHDAAIVCILSHGQNNTVYGVDGKEVRLDELVTSFYRKNAPTLNGKPKLFFIQACRGHGRDTSDVTEDDRADCTSDDGYLECGMVYGSPIGLQDADDSEGGLPETADILLAYSAYKGFRSYRHTVKGSYFVQTLCDVFGHQYSRSHVTEMLRHVKSRVAEDVKACGHYKMMPVTEESMRKKLYFCPT